MYFWKASCSMSLLLVLFLRKRFKKSEFKFKLLTMSMTRIPEHLRDRADRMLEAGINTEEIAPSLAEESEEPFSADRKNR